MPDVGSPIELFYSYAHEDRPFCDKLEKHLSLMRRQGLITQWHDRYISPGSNWAQAINMHLEHASVILLLVSADFLASDYCYSIEMQRVLERHQNKEARVIPILLRPVDWKSAPFAQLQALPANGKPITAWNNQDEAFADIAAGLRQTIEDFAQLSASFPRGEKAGRYQIKNGGLAQGQVIGDHSTIHQHLYGVGDKSTSSTKSERLWNVPYPYNPFFTGRDDLLSRLQIQLQTGQTSALSQPQAISGLGGIGKTQIAMQYAYQHRQDYQAVLWAHAENQERLTSSFVEIAALLDLPEKDAKDQTIIVRAVKNWLRTNHEWLLILDNADELTVVREFLPTRFDGHILLTTRAWTMKKLAHRIEVNTMEQKGGALLLLRRAGLVAHDAPLEAAALADISLAKGITKELGGLPLALDQAGAYIEEIQCRLSDYQSLYRTRRAEVLKEHGGLMNDHLEPVVTTWSLSFQKVEQVNPSAAELLRFCTFLHPDAIPEEIITAGAEHLGSPLLIVARDPLALNKAIATLEAYSLIRHNAIEKTLSIHQLVQAVMRDEMDEQSQQQWEERTIQAVSKACPAVGFAAWKQWERYQPHVLACTDLIEQRDLMLPEAALLLNSLAELYQAQGKYEQAEPLYQHALAICEYQLGPEHPDTATSLNNLATLYQAQGKYEQAEPLLKHALAINEKILGPEHPELATHLNNLAGLYDTQGKYEQAEPLLKHALAIREKQLGPEHPNTATSLNNLALLYRSQGKYEQAEPLLKHALAIREKQLGPEHPNTATSLNNLALLYRSQGKYEQAEPLLKHALAIREKQLGPEHPNTATSLNNLAGLYQAQGKYEQAEPLLKHALAILEQQLGTKHPDTATSLDNLAEFYQAQGKYEQAEPLYQRALAIWEKQLGPEHPSTANSLGNLAVLYQAQGKYEQAEPLLKHALAIWEKQLGPEHPSTANSLGNLAVLYQAQGKYEQAESLYQRALAIREYQLGPEHPDTATSLNNLATLYQAQSKYGEAELLYRRALAIREQQLGAEHPDTAQSLNNLASLYIKQSKYTQAEQLFQRALYVLAQALGPDHPDVIHSRNNLTSLRIKQSQKSEAQCFFEDAGFSFSSLDEPTSFLVTPATPLWQKKIKHTVYVRILTSKRLNGNDVLCIYGTAQEVSEDITLAFVIVDELVEDHAWLQIAALRANNFSVIPIPFTLLIENQTRDKLISTSILLDKHIERFLGRGADPYNIRHPIFDVLNFFGREALARDLIEQMNAGQPIGLFGLRKIGKSSLMRYIRGLMPYPTVCLDLQAGIELTGLYQRVLHSWQNDAMARFKTDLGISDVNLGAGDPTTEFVKITQATLDRIANRNPEVRLAIFLDEIELIIPPLTATGTILERYLSLMRALRGLIQEDGRILLMVAGVDPSINHISRWGDEQKQNPFFMLLKEMYLPPLFELDCIQMIRNIGTQVKLSYSEEAAIYIAQMSGGHPYLARQLCSLAYGQRRQQPGEVTRLAIQQAVERFLFDPKYTSSINASGMWGEVTNVKLWGEQAARANQDVLFTLAQSTDPIAESVITNGPDQAALRSALFSLHELGVVHPVEDPSSLSEPYYAISFGLFHAWIRRIRLGLEG